jgi:hypothetical protein
VLIVVHNEGSLLRSALRNRWPAFCLQHPQLFSPATLEKFLGANGFEVVAQQKTTNAFPFPYLVKTAVGFVGLSGEWADHLPDKAVRLRLGNFATLAKVAS